MVSEATSETTKEAVGVFDNPDKLNEAVAKLESKSFPRHDISVIGDREKVQSRFGEKAVPPILLEDNPDAPRGVWIRPEEKTIGSTFVIGVPAYFGALTGAVLFYSSPIWILALAVLAGLLIGGFIGGLMIKFAKDKLEKNIKRQVNEGGLILWVRTPSKKQEKQALDILRKNGAQHVHLHNIS